MKIRLDVLVPDWYALDLPAKPVVSAMARKVATLIKQRLRKGIGANGSALPTPQRKSGRKRFKPINNTGQMIRAVRPGKYNARTGRVWVWAVGYRNDGRPNELVMASLQRGIVARGLQQTPRQIMGVTDADMQTVTQVAREAIRKQQVRLRDRGRTRSVSR